MGFWEFMVIAALLSFGIMIAKSAGKMRLREQELKYTYQNTASDERLEKLERRIENLETIIIEREKRAEFERL